MMGRNTPLALVGNSLAGLVAASERAQRGQPTVLINPGGPLGGYFAGVKVGGALWDAGMVVLEFTSFRTPANPPLLATYDPMARNDVGRFTHIVRSYIEKHLPTRSISPLQMWVDGQMMPDLLLGNALDALNQMRCKESMREELRRSLPSALESPWHASKKDMWPIRGVPDYELVSRINHGHTLHDAVMGPFARKVLGRDGGHLHALFHRIPWLPLYWPQTLIAALDGNSQILSDTIYSHPVGAPVALLCSRLASEIASHPLVTLINQRVLGVQRHDDGFEIQLDAGAPVRAARLGWSQTTRQGLQACAIEAASAPETRLPLMLVFLRIPKADLRRDFSVIHAVSADTGVYRVNNSSGCAGSDSDATVQIVVEANSEVFSSLHGSTTDDESTTRSVMTDLHRLGIVEIDCVPTHCQVMRLPNALPLPTPEGLNAWGDERQLLLQALPGIDLLAGSAGPFTTSLSDQIVQGLKLAESSDA
jgi:hypothetical protein